MTELITIEPVALDTAGQMAALGAVANHYAAGSTFADYTSRKAPNTIKAQGFDLASFADFLTTAGVAVSGEQLQHSPAAWQGVTWGIVKGFVEWQLKAGHAVASINRRLSTLKVYAALATQAGAVAPSVIPWRDKWAATFVTATDLPAEDTTTLGSITGYGDTPLEAAANMLALAVAMQQRKRP